jgi:meiotically up-regulated gene 157 (Mug157) protein
MHESFNPNRPAQFTRPWFAWANSLFAELVRDRLPLLLLDAPTTNQSPP